VKDLIYYFKKQELTGVDRKFRKNGRQWFMLIYPLFNNFTAMPQSFLK
jgi:hypothetical protein